MINESHCFEKNIKSLPLVINQPQVQQGTTTQQPSQQQQQQQQQLQNIVYGEYQSRLVVNSNDTQIPYELQLERAYYNDIQVSMEDHKTSQSVMISPNKENGQSDILLPSGSSSSQLPSSFQYIVGPIKTVQYTINTVVDQLNTWLNRKDIKYENELYNESNDDDTSTEKNNLAHIKCTSWHPHIRLMAVCNRNDIIQLYLFPQQQQSFSSNNTNLPIMGEIKPISLWIELQSNVLDIKWKPATYPLMLAVSTKNGVILWEIDINDFKCANQFNRISTQTLLHQQYSNSQQSLTNATILNYPYFIPTTLSWSSNGLLLASGSTSNNNIIVWDVASRVPTLVPRNGGNRQLLFSPNDEYLLSSSIKNSRIYDTSKWHYHNSQWNLPSNFISAAWTPNGDYIAISSGDQINFIQCKNKALETYGNLVHVEKTTTYKIHQNGHDHYVGGHIKKIAMSPDGNRLAVIFLRNLLDGTSTDNDKMVAIYRIKNNILVAGGNGSGGFAISPRGFIIKRMHPIESIDFVPQYNKGSLLSVTYSDGVVSFFPLLYSTKYNINK